MVSSSSYKRFLPPGGLKCGVLMVKLQGLWFGVHLVESLVHYFVFQICLIYFLFFFPLCFRL